jgi:hypothetical protein
MNGAPAQGGVEVGHLLNAGPSTLHPSDEDLSLGAPIPSLRFGRSG